MQINFYFLTSLLFCCLFAEYKFFLLMYEFIPVFFVTLNFRLNNSVNSKSMCVNIFTLDLITRHLILTHILCLSIDLCVIDNWIDFVNTSNRICVNRSIHVFLVINNIIEESNVSKLFYFLWIYFCWIQSNNLNWIVAL